MNIIIISDAFWSDPFWVSRHHISNELSLNPEVNRLFFIERNPTFISPLFYKDVKFKQVNFFKSKVTHVSNKLTIISPISRLPFDRKFKWISYLNERKISKLIEELYKSLPTGEKLVLISFDYKTSNVFKSVKHLDFKLIYYVVDDISEFNWPMSSKTQIIEKEIELISMSDLIVATSKRLCARVSMYSKNILHLSHGVKLDYFKLYDKQLENVLLKMKKPIVGFMGKVEQWVDIDLLEKLVRMRPEYSFVILGNDSSLLDGLKKEPNFFFMGPQPKEELAIFLKDFDVGIIPFKQNDLIASVNPLKLYEYMAVGMPIISTPMDAVLNLEDCGVFTAAPSDIEGYLQLLDHILSQPRNKWNQKQSEFVIELDWERKVELLLRSI